MKYFYSSTSDRDGRSR